MEKTLYKAKIIVDMFSMVFNMVLNTYMKEDKHAL